MNSLPRIGIVAPCSPVGQVELSFGAEFLRESGFDVQVHPQCTRQHFIFAGTDQERAEALFQYAHDPQIDVVWAARGGYGAGRLLPFLGQFTDVRGKPPRKLLVGYSDITVLHEFVRKRWGWATLHAPMPGSNLRAIKPHEWQATVDLVCGRKVQIPCQGAALRFVTKPPPGPLVAELIGGNLSLWTTLAGTAFSRRARSRFLFFEDLSEQPYRIDRMIRQLLAARMLDGALAIILGDFTDCQDEDTQVLAPPSDDDSRRRIMLDWSQGQRMSLRKVYPLDDALAEIFGGVGRELGIAVARGLPVGHGPNFCPLPLGARYELGPDGSLRLLRWSWLRRRRA